MFAQIGVVVYQGLLGAMLGFVGVRRGILWLLFVLSF